MILISKKKIEPLFSVGHNVDGRVNVWVASVQKLGSENNLNAIHQCDQTME